MKNNSYSVGCARTLWRFQAARSLLKAGMTAVVMLFLTMSFHLTLAQDNSVTGKVTDAAGMGLPGVSVSVKGTTRGTNTDAEGAYKIQAPSGSVLVFSSVGFQSQEISIGARSTVDVKLADDNKILNEVVVVGYGTAKRKDLTGAVTNVTAKEFNAGIVPNPLQAIQGKVAGLVITTPSGDPNSNPTVRLRGYTSLAGGSDPLYVVDGVIGVPINTISPDDIETMDVLKDASAAAIYGSRAANGVIIVTTKRGKTGKPTVTFNNFVGVETISNRLNLLSGDEYRAEVSRIKGASALSDRQRFPVDASGQGFSTDWIKEITRTAYTNNHDLAIAGGSPGLSYRGSLNFVNREGIVKNTGFQRATGRINIDQKALDNRLSVQYNLAFTNTMNQLTDGEIIGRATIMLPTLPVRAIDNGETNFAGYYEIPGSFDLYNPVAMLENQKFDEQRRQFIGGINLRYEILDGLTIGVNGAFRNENNDQNRFRSGNVRFYLGENGRASRRFEQVNDQLLETTLNYTKGFGEGSNFSVLGGYSYQSITADGFGAGNSQFVTDVLGYNNLGLGAGTVIAPGSGYVASFRNNVKVASFFGRGIVNLNDRYNVTATLRYDGSSKLGANNKWGLFPSVAAGWNISNESFFPKNAAINFMKLRVGWGQTGNSEGIIPYNSIQLYGQKGGNFYNGAIDNFLPGYGITQNANPNLRWEVKTTTNIGLDFQLLNSRFSGTVEYYTSLTDNLLYNYSVPANGIDFFTDRILANVGQMRNSGFELSFGGDVIRKGDFNWNTRIIGAYNTNQIVTLSNEQFGSGTVRFNAFGGRGLSDVFGSYLFPGRPVGEFNNVPTFAGFGADGKVLLRSGKGDGTTTEIGDADAAARFAAGNPLAQGNPQPFLTASLVNTFNYKNFDLNFLLRGVFGNSILNNVRSNLLIPGSILETNMLRGLSDLPNNYTQNQISTYWLESGTFVRFDNWQLGYRVPVKNSKFIQNARIYVGGNNLFILTGYKGIDPELEVRGDLNTSNPTRGDLQSGAARGNLGAAPTSLGIDSRGIYPRTRSFQLGVNLTF
jgi:TonB-dependent starch-binding outer membrane protein SusC